MEVDCDIALVGADSFGIVTSLLAAWKRPACRFFIRLEILEIDTLFFVSFVFGEMMTLVFRDNPPVTSLKLRRRLGGFRVGRRGAMV